MARVEGTTIIVPPNKNTPPLEESNEVIASNFVARIEALGKMPKTDGRIPDLYQKASDAFKEENYKSSESALKDILKIDPYDIVAYQLLRQMQVKRSSKLDSQAPQ